MSNLNSLSVIGRLGHDPEQRSLPSGDPVVNISVATSETWKDKSTGERRERTIWFRVAFFSRLAEIAAEYLHKGSLVYVEGPVSARAYKTREGEPAASLEIRANQLRMLSGRGDSDNGASRAAEVAAIAASEKHVPPWPGATLRTPVPDFDDKIPF